MLYKPHPLVTCNINHTHYSQRIVHLYCSTVVFVQEPFLSAHHLSLRGDNLPVGHHPELRVPKRKYMTFVQINKCMQVTHRELWLTFSESHN